MEPLNRGTSHFVQKPLNFHADLLQVSYPVSLLGHQLAVLSRDGHILPYLAQQLGGGLTLLSQHYFFPLDLQLQAAHLVQGMAVAAQSKGELGRSQLSFFVDPIQFMHKPDRIVDIMIKYTRDI